MLTCILTLSPLVCLFLSTSITDNYVFLLVLVLRPSRRHLFDLATTNGSVLHFRGTDDRYLLSHPPVDATY